MSTARKKTKLPKYLANDFRFFILGALLGIIGNIIAQWLVETSKAGNTYNYVVLISVGGLAVILWKTRHLLFLDQDA